MSKYLPKLNHRRLKLAFLFPGASQAAKPDNLLAAMGQIDLAVEKIQPKQLITWCDALKPQSQLAANPTLYGANIKTHTCTNGAIRAGCLFESSGAT